MKIAIVGAGIVGVSTAYELARDGHEVTVFEQRNAAAEEASFANAGLTNQERVVLGTARENLDDATNFIIATDYRIKFSIAGASGQVDAILLERGFLVFTHVG